MALRSVAGNQSKQFIWSETVKLAIDFLPKVFSNGDGSFLQSNAHRIAYVSVNVMKAFRQKSRRDRLGRWDQLSCKSPLMDEEVNMMVVTRVGVVGDDVDNKEIERDHWASQPTFVGFLAAADQVVSLRCQRMAWEKGLDFTLEPSLFSALTPFPCAGRLGLWLGLHKSQSSDHSKVYWSPY